MVGSSAVVGWLRGNEYTYMNQNDCKSHVKVRNSFWNIQSLIIKGEVCIRNDYIGMNANSFSFSFQVSKHAMNIILNDN